MPLRHGLGAGIGEAGGHVQQVLHQAGAQGRHRIQPPTHGHLLVFKAGEKGLHRGHQVQIAPFIEHHGRGRGEGLAHGIHAADGIPGHRGAALPAGKAPEGGELLLSPVEDQHAASCQRPFSNFPFQNSGHAL